jgi:replicative DNA helicase
MEDKKLFTSINSVLDQNMFTDTNLKTFVSVMKDYYARNSVKPSYQMMQIKLSEKAVSDIENKTYIALVKKIKDTSSEGSLEIKDLALRFFRQQHLVRAANEVLKIAGNGDANKYEECVKYLSDAFSELSRGDDDDLGENIYDDLDETLSTDYRKPIPLGIGKIDEALNGGIGAGELALIAGSMGFGKTSIAVAIANYASTFKCDDNGNNGFNVLQINFEDGDKSIKRKHFSRITQTEASELSKPDYIEDTREKVLNYEDKDIIVNNLRIKEFPTGSKTASDIRKFVMRLINSGYKPQMMIVDYFECLKMSPVTRSETQWTIEAQTMRQFENMAKEFEMAVIVTSQGTKDSVAAEVMTNEKVGGAKEKTQIPGIIITIARTLEQQNKKIATIAITKNRFGPSGQVWNNVIFDNATCTISTDEAEMYQDMTDFRQKEAEDEQELQRSVFRSMKEAKRG